MTTTTETAHCEGCNRELGALEAMLWSVCMDCTQRRARTVGNGGRCTCRSKNRQKTCSSGSRRWISCLRCLGTIRQLPDAPRRVGR